MILKNITKDNHSIIKEWLKNDSIGQQFVAEYEDTMLIFRLLGPKRKFWLAYNDKIPIGFLDLEIDQQKGYFTFYIAPKNRGKGLSQEILNLLEQQAKKLSISLLYGYIETDNLASIRSLQKVNYIQSQRLDKDGLIEFSKKVA